MTDAPTAEAPTISGNLPFYKKPEPISATRHGKLGIKRVEQPFGFAKSMHVAPATVSEFPMGGLDYPIIFVGPDRAPLLVMGLRENENLFVTPDGVWENHRYLPAFVRRYPFVFAEDKQNERFVACIDVEAPMVAENAETPLFEGEEPSAFTRDAINFLTSFEQQRQATREFCVRLRELDLFEEAKVTFTPANADGSQGEPRTIAEYVGISADKVAALSADQLTELNQKGFLRMIHYHQHSLNNWQKLINRAGERQAQEGGQAGAANGGQNPGQNTAGTTTVIN